MTQENSISLLGNASLLQSLRESTWVINTMKTIQYFDRYRSNTYLVDSRNSQNENLLSQISKSDIFGCYFDIRAIEGNSKINQLVVACTQGVVIFNSIERESNAVMKNFITTISNKKCYARGITSYHKLLNLYNLNIEKMINVDTNDNYSDFIEFRKQSSFTSFSENYREKSKFQLPSSTNSVLDCLLNAFEAACVDFYFTNLNKKENLISEIRSQPSFPPGMNIPQDFDYPPGLGPQPKQANSIEPLSPFPIPQQDKPKKTKGNVTFGPISADILKSTEKKQTEIDKRFWKNLDTLIAILSSTKKIETENGKYFCKTCNKNFVSYEFLLEHCWDEHKSALE